MPGSSGAGAGGFGAAGARASGGTGQAGESGAPGASGELGDGGRAGSAGTAADGADGGYAGDQAGGSSAEAGSAGSAGQPDSACGNHIREALEQCDDGNRTKLDGCSDSCRFEQSLRSNSFKVRFAPDALCTNNAFGSAFGVAARAELQASLDERVANGNFSLLFSFPNLADLTGTSARSLTLGVLSGEPVAGGGYDGTSDLDWWYTAAPSSIDAKRNPRTKLSGSISATLLSAGPGVIGLPLLSAAPLALSEATLKLSLGAVADPLLSIGEPPGHLESEQLDPTLTSFANAGESTSNGVGELCANISATSLAKEAVPASYLENGALACDEGYTPDNSFLELLVHGCSRSGVKIVAATQPDQVDPAAPVLGAGGPYRFVTTGGHLISRCRDVLGVNVPLDACLDAAAYSSAYRLSADRVIIK